MSVNRLPALKFQDLILPLKQPPLSPLGWTCKLGGWYPQEDWPGEDLAPMHDLEGGGVGSWGHSTQPL